MLQFLHRTIKKLQQTHTETVPFNAMNEAIPAAWIWSIIIIILFFIFLLIVLLILISPNSQIHFITPWSYELSCEGFVSNAIGVLIFAFSIAIFIYFLVYSEPNQKKQIISLFYLLLQKMLII